MRKTLLAAVAASAAGIGLLTPGTASAAAETWSYQAALNPVAANLVSGNGASWISVTGNTAEVQIQVNGLLDGAPHAQSIRIDAQGSCPAQVPPSGPISATDGRPLYGAVGAALTTDGDSSPAAALTLSQFPAAGSYTYSRTIDLGPPVIAALQNGTAVLLVQGVDLNGNGSFDAGASELDPNLPAEATDPALCGTFEPMQMAGVPAGPADTGGGSTAINPRASEVGQLAGAAVALIIAAAGALLRRPRWKEHHGGPATVTALPRNCP